MKLVSSHPTANANVRAAVNGFLEAGLLYRFHTSVASFPGTLLSRLSGLPGLSEIKRRGFDARLAPFTTSWPFKETGRMIAAKAGVSALLTHETGVFSIDAVYHYIDRMVAATLEKASARGVSAVYAYEDEALNSFREARRLGVQCLYDLPIGYWRAARRLLENERERWPEWAPTLTGFRDSAAKLERKDEELTLADAIYTASTFTAETLADYPGSLSPVHVIPYGFPTVTGGRVYQQGAGIKRPLKLLFVGGLSQRKGVADLFAAVAKLGSHVELTVVGHKVGGTCRPLNDALARHTWIPALPHHEILQLMRAHDVLVFPSLFEGFGLVITEAMAQGTPVITTDRTAGPDVITHGKNGWLIPAGSALAIEETIDKLLQQPDLLEENGAAAMLSARQRPWQAYGVQLAASVAGHMQPK